MKKSTRYRTIEVLELLSGSVLPILFWLFLIFGFDAPYVAVLTVISAISHELGHCIAISVFTGKDGRVRGHSSGFRIKRSESVSYGKEIAILLAGPTVNLVLFLLLCPFLDNLSGYLGTFAFINLATGISNLLPLEGYDGYGAISEIMRSFGRADLIKHLECFSFILSIAVTFISLYLIDRFGEGFWIFGLFFFTVVSKVISFGKYDIFGE